MEYTKIKKYYLYTVGFWYFSHISMIYSLFPLNLDSPNSVLIGRITTAIDSLVMLLVFTLYIFLVKNAFKVRDYKYLLLATLLVIIPIIWAFATVDDTFGTYTVSRFI